MEIMNEERSDCDSFNKVNYFFSREELFSSKTAFISDKLFYFFSASVSLVDSFLVSMNKSLILFSLTFSSVL